MLAFSYWQQGCYFYRVAICLLYAAKICLLFTGLEAQHASLVIEPEGKGVPYRLEDGGLTIAVPEDQVYELRIELAGERFYAGPGLGTFDADGHVGAAGDAESLQEEPVDHCPRACRAGQHIWCCPSHHFCGNSGAHRLCLAFAASLSPSGANSSCGRQRGGLKPENVVWLTSGKYTARQPDGHGFFHGGGESAMQQYEVKRAFEKELERRVQHMERVFGPGKPWPVSGSWFDPGKGRSLFTMRMLSGAHRVGDF